MIRCVTCARRRHAVCARPDAILASYLSSISTVMFRDVILPLAWDASIIFQKFVVRRCALRGLAERLPIPKSYGVLACMHSRDAKLSGTVPQPDALYGGGIFNKLGMLAAFPIRYHSDGRHQSSPLGSPVRERNRASEPGWRHK